MALNLPPFDTTPETFLRPREDQIQLAMQAIPDVLQLMQSDSGYEYLLPEKHHRVLRADTLAAALMDRKHQPPAAYWAIHFA